MHGPLGEVTEHSPEALVAFIGSQRVEHDVPHRVTCRVVGVSEAWSYKSGSKNLPKRCFASLDRAICPGRDLVHEYPHDLFAAAPAVPE
jgi:hypothetical protein